MKLSKKKVAAALSAALPFLSFAGLEGGNTGTEPEWKSAPPIKQPTASERAQEVNARKTAIEADIARLKARMQKTASSSDQQKLKSEVDRIYKTHGWCPKLETAFGKGSLEAFQKDQTKMDPKTLQAFIQFDRDMKARGIDLILMPGAPKIVYEGHRLVPGMDATTEVWPGWTNMAIQLLENDVEVIDTVEEFRKAAGSKIPVTWINEPHTGPMGRKIFGEALAKRLQRYAFSRELQAKPKAFTYTERKKTGAKMVTLLNNRAWINERWWEKTNRGRKPFPYDDPQAVDAGLKTRNKNHKGWVYVYPPLTPTIIEDLKKLEYAYYHLQGKPSVKEYGRLDLAMIGDSQLHTAVLGSGLPAIIQAETNGLYRWGSKSWSGFSAPDIFLEVIPTSVPQPRVVVMWFLPNKFFSKKPYTAKSMPPVKGGKQVAAAAGVPEGNFTATVEILSVPNRRNPRNLSYSEALNHFPAVVKDGPFAGQEIGIRSWSMVDSELMEPAFAIKKGTKIKVSLMPWEDATKKFKGISQHMVFNDSDQDLLIPIFWISGGKLSAKDLKVTK